MSWCVEKSAARYEGSGVRRQYGSPARAPAHAPQLTAPRGLSGDGAGGSCPCPTMTEESYSGSNVYLTAEAQARVQIDKELVAAGWLVQDAQSVNLAAGEGVAVREFVLK